MQKATSKTDSGRFYEDFEVGSELEHAIPRTVTEGDQALYIGLTGDRNPVHCSAELARALGYQRETVHDLLVFHIVFGKTVGDISLNAIANLGYAGLRFLLPVYPGDTLRAFSTIVGKRENRSGDTGIVWVQTRGENQRGEVVLEYYRWVMVRKRDPETPATSHEPPAMPESVPLADLVVPRALELRSFGRWSWATGGKALLEDYAVGETIDHVDGMTIEESEHAIATRLYQNTAKVHFDARLASETRFGRRLIYGGHIISIARALSFNGLQNALGLLAFNGGTHANPCFAGDTIYAMSEVLDAQPLAGRDDCGALRLRLVATKNEPPTADRIRVEKDAKGRVRYDPAVVLDLDIWALMPRHNGR